MKNNIIPMVLCYNINMMTHFTIKYIPGGMGLSHSAWWLCERILCQGVYIDSHIRKFKEADYK